MKTYAERFLLAHADKASAADDMATAAEMMHAIRETAKRTGLRQWGVSEDLWTMLNKATAAYREADQRLVEIAGAIGNDPRYDDWTAEDGYPTDAAMLHDGSTIPAALALDVMQASRSTFDATTGKRRV